MGQVAEVKYDSIIKEKDNGYLMQFGDRAVWIHVGYLYAHDRKRKVIALPESFILEKTLDPFKLQLFAFAVKEPDYETGDGTSTGGSGPEDQGGD